MWGVDFSHCSLQIQFLILAAGTLNAVIKYNDSIFLKPDTAKHKSLFSDSHNKDWFIMIIHYRLIGNGKKNGLVSYNPCKNPTKTPLHMWFSHTSECCH